MSTALSLRFGQPQILPDTATAAWGARMIVTQTGDVDFLGDRSDASGDTDALFLLLDMRCSLPLLRDTIGDLLRRGWMQTRQGEDFIVHQDDQLTIHANTNGSAGYCYVTAWLG
jgi:hypothetical protein